MGIKLKLGFTWPWSKKRLLQKQLDSLQGDVNAWLGKTPAEVQQDIENALKFARENDQQVTHKFVPLDPILDEPNIVSELAETLKRYQVETFNGQSYLNDTKTGESKAYASRKSAQRAARRLNK